MSIANDLREAAETLRKLAAEDYLQKHSAETCAPSQELDAEKVRDFLIFFGDTKNGQ